MFNASGPRPHQSGLVHAVDEVAAGGLVQRGPLTDGSLIALPPVGEQGEHGELR
jgi:hypothetical protein